MALILTLGFDSPSFALFEGLRQRHFPPARNAIPAHVTLFQQLPSPRLNRLQADLAGLADRTAPLSFSVTEVMAFRQGAAAALEVAGLDALHGDLRAAWHEDLADSDRGRRRWHVTIQNRAQGSAIEAARADLAPLVGLTGTLPWLDLWHYRGFPWERAGRYPLAGGIE